MQRFRRKPLEAQAFQWLGPGQTPDAMPLANKGFLRERNFHTELWMHRIQAWVRINLGDWIVADPHGSGCDVYVKWHFEADYEPLEETVVRPSAPSRPRTEGLI